MNVPDRPHSAQIVFDTARAIASSSAGLQFPEAHALCRVVLDFGGGPVRLRGRGAPPFDRKTVRTLERGGWLERGGDESSRHAHVASLLDLSSTPDTWAVTVTFSDGRLAADQVCASDEALELVAHFVKLVGPRDLPAAAHSAHSRTSEDEEDDDDDGDDWEGPEDPFADVEDVGDLGDVEHLASELFDIWLDGAELRCAAYLWDVLARAGLTSYDEGDEVERTLVLCRLVALAGISREFAVRAWEEGDPDEWQEHLATTDLVGDYPLIDPIALGRLAQREHTWVAEVLDDGREPAWRLVAAVAAQQWSTVAKALLEDLGAALLFATLWMAPQSGARFPLPAEVFGDAVNSDVHDGKLTAYAWVDNGCRR